MKDWILKHKKIYFAVVFGIALALFMAITVRGCNKLEKAYAATTTNGTYYPDLLSEVPLGDLKEQVESMVESNSYIIVTKIGNDYYYVFSNTKLGAEKSSDRYLVGSAGVFPIRYDVTNNIVEILSGATSVSVYNSGTNYVIGSNYDYRDGWSALDYCPYNNLEYPTPAPVINHTHSSNYPYLQYYDGHFSRDARYVGWWLLNLKKYASQGTILDTSIWTWYGELGLMGDVPAYTDDVFIIDRPMIYTDVTVNAMVPSPAYIKSLIQNGVSPVEVMDFEDFESWLEDSRLKNDNNALKFSIVRSVEGVVFYEKPYTISIQLDTSWINSGLTDLEGQEALSAMREMYGLTESEWAVWSPIIYGYFTMENLKSTCYCAVSSTEYVYGPTTVYRFLDTYCEDAVEIIIRDDIYDESLPDDYIDRVVNQTVTDKIIDVKNDAELFEQKVEELEQQYAELGKFGVDFEGGNLWTAIKGLGSGLLNMSSTFGGIGSAIGQVFSFIPSDILSIIFYSVTAMCLIAVWKMLRG